MAGAKSKRIKAVAISLGVLLVALFVLLVLQRIDPVLFFVIAAVIAFVAYVIIPRMR